MNRTAIYAAARATLSTLTAGSGPTKYTYWLSEEGSYYVVVEPIDGFMTTYKNRAGTAYADVTDRVYNGGTIINTMVPTPAIQATRS